MTQNKIHNIGMEPAIGSIVLVKQPVVFYRVDPVEIIDKIISNKLGLLISCSTFNVEYFSDERKDTVGYKLSIVFDEQVYNVTCYSTYELFQNFDFIKLPEQTTENGALDNWLTIFFRASGQIFRVLDEVDVYGGESKNKNKTSFSKNVRLSKYSVIVGNGIRVDAMRRLVVFDFFANGQPCWMGFKENKGKKYINFHHRFKLVGGTSPYEEEIRKLKEKEVQKER